MGTPANSTAFLVQGQAYNTSVTLLATSNGLPITGGLASISGQISINDGAFANLATAPTEAPAGSSILTVDLSGTEMTGAKIVIRLSATGSYVEDRILNPMNLSEVSGRADLGQKLFEQYILQSWAADVNQQDAPTYSPGTHVIYKSNGTIWLQGTDTVGTNNNQIGTLSRGKLS